MQYLPISEIEDESYNISKEEIAINKGDSVILFKTLHTMFSNNTWRTFGLAPELKRRLFETVHEQYVQLATYYLELHQDDIECMFGDLQFFTKTKCDKHINDIYLGSF